MHRTNRTHRPAALFGAALLILLAGCSWTDTRPTTSGGEIYDDSGIPDVIPRVETQTNAGNPQKYKIFGKRYRVMSNAEARGYRKRGKASWYGEKFHGRRTSNGEIYNMFDVTAAHKTLRIPSYVQVTHLKTGRSIVVRVNDRGPFVDDRIIDLSFGAATKLGMVNEGVADVEIELIDPTTYVAPAPKVRVASTTIDYAKMPDATTFPMDAGTTQNVAPPPYSTAVEVIGDISALPQSRAVQPVNTQQRDASEYVQPSTPTPASEPGNVQYRVAASGDLVTEDFTEVYIAENQIAEYERLNPEEVQTAPAAMQGAVTEVAFGTSPVAERPMAVQTEAISSVPQPSAISAQAEVASITRANDGGHPFYVQVATFGNPDNAIKMAEKLASQQFTPVRLVPGDFGGKQLQQVRVGPYFSAQQASAQQAAIVQAGYPGCFVLRSKN